MESQGFWGGHLTWLVELPAFKSGINQRFHWLAWFVVLSI